MLCDDPDLPIVLSAVERPSPVGAPDRDRLFEFEAVWTVDPPLGREPARPVVTGLLDSVIRQVDRHVAVQHEAG